MWGGAVTTFPGKAFRWEGKDNPQPTEKSGNIITAEGGAETRPNNVAIFYYIRIN